MTRFLVSVILIVFSATTALFAQSLQSPDDFLGYSLGDRFTRHHRMVEYFQHVASQTNLVKLAEYGKTYEHRPLIYAVIASPENLKNIEQIREDNLKRTGLLSGKPSTQVAIVWLSYTVHGNEASSTESAMKVLYELVNPQNQKTQQWLKNTIVIIDPCLNPDGRDRFTNFFYETGALPANADPQAREHRETWPPGRSNHYLFDLNRDWAWLSQKESQHRLKIYNQWMPHVHVDYHEQGYNSPYYFAPAAEPFHEVITPWQRDFQTQIGKNNAKYFDQEGWFYFTKERFDLYYPSYGDTYPTYSGSIGMTYEKGGIGSGLIVTTREGDPMTLKDRLTHHFTTAMATLEISSMNAARLTEEFEKYFRDVNAGNGLSYKTYVIKATNSPDQIRKITQWMDAHQIRYGHTRAPKTLRGFDYQTQQSGNAVITSDDIIIPVGQPKGKFITTVFEPQSKLADSLTYDITAWNLMYAHDLKAFALPEKLLADKPYEPRQVTTPTVSPNTYAYFLRYQSVLDAEYLGALLQKGINVRVLRKATTMQGKRFEQGSLVITRRNNETVANFDQWVTDLAKKYQRELHISTTGWSDQGYDVGSGEVSFLEKPNVAILGGDQTSSLSFGEVWHFFEQTLQYPATVIGTDYFRSIDLWKYNVLVCPEGSYRIFDDSTLEMIQRWVSDGGRLILIGNALNSVAGKNGFDLKVYQNDDKKKDAEKKDKESKEKEGLIAYDEAERKELSNAIFGAIYKVSIDRSHPLAAGLGEHYFSLKTNSLHFDFLENGWNTGVIKGKAKPLQGFAGYKINRKLDNTLVFGLQNKGKGEIVYFVDNPLFRSFWENGKLLFANAVFLSGD
jgi:hypothetical protein